jgi:hypothetical protein
MPMTMITIFLGLVLAIFIIVLLLFVSLLDVSFKKVEELHGDDARRDAQRQLFNITSDTFRQMMAEARRRLDQ